MISADKPPPGAGQQETPEQKEERCEECVQDHVCRETAEQREESAGAPGTPAALGSDDQASLQTAETSPLADTTSSGPSSGHFSFDTLETVASIELGKPDRGDIDKEFEEWF